MKELWVIIGIYDDAAGLVAKCAELAEQRGLRLKVYSVGEAGPEYERCICRELVSMVRRTEPEAVIFERTDFLADVAPAFAAVIGTGITADCTELEWDDTFGLLQIRPTFGGRKIAYNISVGKPFIATVRRGTFAAAAGTRNPEEIIPLSGKEADRAVSLISSAVEEEIIRLESADLIVSGGLGLGSRENYQKLQRLAALTGAQLGASRAAVAAGYTNYSRQVGQTGVSVRPSLYIAFGISGAVQHLCGILGAKKIIAVNLDEKAPIREYSDYFLQADAVSVLDFLVDKFEKEK